MAEAPGSPLTQLLEDVFVKFSDQLTDAIPNKLGTLGRSGHPAGDKPAVARFGAGPDETALLNLGIRIEGEETTWFARLGTALKDSETELTAEHLLLGGAEAVTGWQTSRSVKTETGEQRPELLEAAAELMSALASEESVAAAVKRFDLERSPTSQPDIRQQPVSGTASSGTPFPGRQQTPPNRSEEDGLSFSVGKVRDALASHETVTAIDIAAELRESHGEYAAREFGRQHLEPAPVALARPWGDWVSRIRDLVDPAAGTDALEMIHGRVLLAGLALLEPALLRQLDASGVWARLLGEIDEDVLAAAPALREAKERAGVSFAHGYLNDDPEGRDRLNIEGEVNALSEVVTDPKVLPPLAIGLFGEWGSGKSFFMEKMRQRIHQIDQAPPEPDTPPGDIIQIRFNP